MIDMGHRRTEGFELSIYSRVDFAAEPPPTIPLPPPPEPLPVPTEPPSLPVPSPEPTRVVIDLPSELVDLLNQGSGGPSWLTVFSGVGAGAITAAVISGFILWLVERKRQSGENTRKTLELDRQDLRQWDQKIIDHYVEARRLARELSSTASYVKIYSCDIPDPSEVHKQFTKAMDLRRDLEAVIDRMHVIGNKRVATAFEALRKPVRDYYFGFRASSDLVYTYAEDKVVSLKLNLDAELKEMLAAVRERIRVLGDTSDVEFEVSLQHGLAQARERQEASPPTAPLP